MPRARTKKHVSSHLVRQGVSLFLLGGVLLLVSLVLVANASPLVRTVGTAIRTPLPYAVGLGVLLAIVGYMLRPSPEAAASRPTSDPVWFPAESTDFARSTVQVDPGSPANPLRRVRPPSATWNLQVFDDIEWKRFEMLCAHLFEQAGFEAHLQSHGADGGVDIWLHSRNAEGPVAVVQCKHWLTREVGVREVRELLGVMSAQKVTRGTFVTTSRFTAEAERFGRENGIHLLDCTGLLVLIARRTPEQQAELLAHAYEGEYWRPTCASCGLKMVERTARKGGAAFWGCATYPRCRFTLPMRVPA